VIQTDAGKRDAGSPSSPREASGARGDERPELATHPSSTNASSTNASPDVDARESRKERVLHTRVPAVLERELKRFADNLRVPVSNLVRTILEDALSAADAATENVEERLRRAAERLEKEREKLRKRMEHDPLAGVVAFQDVTLAVSTDCVKCSRTMASGSRAHFGIGDGSHGHVFVCESCGPRGNSPQGGTIGGQR